MMCMTGHEAIDHRGGAARVDVVDNWHKDWPKVLQLIDRLGQRDALMLDDDGWISARQSVLAVFDAERRVTGHLCFRIQPTKPKHGGAGFMEAHIDCFGVAEPARRRDVAKQLHEAATDLAKTLKLRKVHGLEKVS